MRHGSIIVRATPRSTDGGLEYTVYHVGDGESGGLPNARARGIPTGITYREVHILYCCDGISLLSDSVYSYGDRSIPGTWGMVESHEIASEDTLYDMQAAGWAAWDAESYAAYCQASDVDVPGEGKDDRNRRINEAILAVRRS